MTDIQNSQALTNIFGKWPSFHDAEIVRICLNREGKKGPYLEACIYVFEQSSEVDETGHYILKNPTLVTFHFTHIVLESLKWFNQQNVLWDLEITDILPQKNEGCNFRVEMPSSFGCEARFNCREIIVDKVEPYEKN
jgi:hypothetical protein